MSYHFKITIEGDSEDKESIDRLYRNLHAEVWHENSVIHEPEITSTKTHCYRCGEHCEWDGPTKTYPRVLDIVRPSCPADSPMPKEFGDDGP